MAQQRLASKSWSCGTLVSGAAQVVDMAALPAASALAQSESELLGQLEQLTVEELQKVLEDA